MRERSGIAPRPHFNIGRFVGASPEGAKSDRPKRCADPPRLADEEVRVARVQQQFAITMAWTLATTSTAAQEGRRADGGDAGVAVGDRIRE